MSLSRLLLLIIIALGLISCAKLKTKSYSSKEDDYWTALAKEAGSENKSIFKILELKNPILYKQIIKDSEDSSLITFWGKSLNFDSGAKKKILPEQLITELQQQFGIKNDNMIVHAGVTHTYGYLFSIVETPYGFKRKRWIDPTLDYAFSFNRNSLSPDSIEGGMLSNITYFMGRIAFKNKNNQLELKKIKNVSTEVLNFDYSKLSTEVLEEQIKGEGISLRTSLVSLPFKREGEENDYLLIYSVFYPKTKKEVLITAFPIKKDAYKKITATESLGANQPIVVRYNGYLDGLMDQKLIGIRKISQVSL